jgi:DNA-binding transcriptional LysR family regulator
VRIGPLRDTSLVARRIGLVGSGLVASPKYIARKGEPRTLEDLAGHDCVLFRPMSGKGTWPLSHEDGREVAVAVNGSVASDDLMFVHRAVLAGAGIGLVPEFLYEPDTAKGRLVHVLPRWSMKGAMAHVVYPSARFVPQRVVAFRDFLLRELPGHIGRERPRGDDAV